MPDNKTNTATPPGWGNEFSLIDRLISIASDSSRHPSALVVPPGDDAALLATIPAPVVSTDTQRENIHFRLDWQTPEEIGYKAVTVTLSDLAASYAVPAVLFINLGLPSNTPAKTIEGIYHGVKQALDNYSCTIGGGNVSSASELSLDLFAIGSGDTSSFPLRSNAKHGEGLYVTGPVGLARAGLDALKNNRLEYMSLISRFKSPTARFDAAAILKENGVRCAMDISDGLCGDANHIANASNVSIEFDLSGSHLPPDLVNYCSRFGYPPHEFALAGGEDYELLFSCTPEMFKRIRPLIPEAFRVGTCLPFTGTHIINPPAGQTSFQHGS